MKERVEEEENKKSAFVYILAVFLIFLLLLTVVPYFYIKQDPEPKSIPNLDEIIPRDIKLEKSNIEILSSQDYFKLINPTDPIIKRIADKIVVTSCESNRICQSKALFYFVRDNYKYIPDPIGKEYIEDPKEFLSIGGGDCESGSIALANLEVAIGVETQLVFIPNHVYIRIKLPDALKMYKRNGDWVYLDWTCKSCNFGEVHYTNLDKPETYLAVN
jgi:transglutaminase-like putative cysteine protease